MSFYESLPKKHHLVALWHRFPRGVKPLLELHDAFLRNMDSDLQVGERELIAAHVSAINGCTYCFVAHRRYACAFGIDPSVFGEADVQTDHSSLRPEMTAALGYVEKLTEHPANVDQADFDALTDAGWSEDAIHDIVCVTAIYAFMNRLLEGSGMKENIAPPGFTPEKARAGRYTDMLEMIRGGQK